MAAARGGGPSFDIVLSDVPEEAVGYLIVKDLAVKGFSVLSTDFDGDTLGDAARDAEELSFYPASMLIVDGLLGAAGSAYIAELESGLDEEARVEGASIIRLDKYITHVGHALEPHVEYIGFDMTHRSDAVVHMPRGADQDAPEHLSLSEASKWYSQFVRQKVMVLVFLGPAQGTLTLTPFEIEDTEPYSFKTTPGMMVVLRTDILLHQYTVTSDANNSFVLSSFLMTGEAENEARYTRVPVVASLTEWSHGKLRELKAEETARGSYDDPDIPRGWQSAAHKMYVDTQMVGISGFAGYLPQSGFPEAFVRASAWGPDYGTEVPLCRWNHGDVYDGDPDSWMRMKTSCRHGAFMEGIELFDNARFSLSPNETRGMFPSNRVCLEVSYQCFFNMGYKKSMLFNKLAGIYVGCDSDDSKGADIPQSCHVICMYSGRVAFSLGLKGPAITVTNEGSTSTAIVQLAADSVQAKGCAVSSHFSCAMSVFLVLTAMHWPAENFAGRLSREGRCFTYGSNSDGHIRADGACALGMKLFAEYVDHELVLGDSGFHATIAGIHLKTSGGARMSDCHTLGAQICMAECLHGARLSPLDVCSVEGHAAGAFIEDAMEAVTLSRGLRRSHSADPLSLMFGKPSAGYSKENAGMVVFISTVINGPSGIMCPGLHLRQVNPHIEAPALPLNFVTELCSVREKSVISALMTRSNTGSTGFALLRTERAEGDLPPSPAAPPEKIVFWPGGGGALEEGMRPVRKEAYYIAGTWSRWKDPQLMRAKGDGLYTFAMTLGENLWECFQIWLDGQSSRVLHPDQPNAPPCSPVLGPDDHQECGVGPSALNWLVDGRYDGGRAGDQYCISLRISGMWQLVDWQRERVHDDGGLPPSLQAPPSAAVRRGQYSVCGSWSRWSLEAMRGDESASPGCFVLEVRLLEAGGEFQIVRDEDWSQVIYPCNSCAGADDASLVLGPDDQGSGLNWFLDGEAGDEFRIQFQRTWEDDTDVKAVAWQKVGHRPLSPGERLDAARPYYSIVGSWDDWRSCSAMDDQGEYFQFYVRLAGDGQESFQVVQNGARDQVVHPDRPGANPHERHSLRGPARRAHGLNWTIGRHEDDAGEAGACYEVRLNVNASGEPWTLVWRKLSPGEMPKPGFSASRAGSWRRRREAQ